MTVIFSVYSSTEILFGLWSERKPKIFHNDAAVEKRNNESASYLLLFYFDRFQNCPFIEQIQQAKKVEVNNALGI